MANSISGNCGVPGAYVTAYGPSVPTFGYATADGSGNYTISGLPTDTYQVACSSGKGLIVYIFSPSVSVQTIVSSDLTGVNFTASIFTPPNPGIWTKKGSVIPSATGQGIQPGTVMYESGSQLGLGAGNVFKMWYYDGPSVCYAESLTGLPGAWTVYGSNPIIANKMWVTVFKHAGTYYLYCAPNSGGNISVYTSVDGLTFSLQGTALSIGAAGTWDHGFLYQLNVIEIDGGGTWHALYTGGTTITSPGSTQYYAFGHATSSDGLTWTKDTANNPVWFNGSASTFITKVGSTYYTWFNYAPYFEYQSYNLPTDVYRIQSTDYVHWTNPIPAIPRTNSVEGPGETYTQGQAGNVTMIEVGGITYAYYLATLKGASINPSDATIQLATAPIGLTQIVAGNEGVTGLLVDTVVLVGNAASSASSLSAPTFYAKAGNIIIVHVRMNTTGKTVSSIEDTAGNTYTAISTLFDSSAGAGGSGRFFICNNCLSSAANIVKANFSASDNYCGMTVWQISGGPTSGIKFDFDASNNMTGTVLSSASFHTNHASEIVLATSYVAGLDVSAPGTGMVNDGTISTYVGCAEHVAYSTEQTGQTVTVIPVHSYRGTVFAAGFGVQIVSGNAGVGGATVSYSGAASGSVTVDALGNYAILGLVDGSYTITPSKTGYIFSPTSASETVSGADITGVNFTAWPVISGIGNPSSICIQTRDLQLLFRL